MTTVDLSVPNSDIFLSWASNYLESRSVPNPEIDAKLILLYSQKMALDFKHLIRLRGARYPLQYIIGSTSFMGFEFKIRPGVFIPRPETELLVETTLRYISSLPTILDLCTGCGNIAISLAKLLENVKVVATDISDESITVAEENMKLHGCNEIKLIKSDLFEKIDENQFDIIVSNPPYISEEDLATLIPEVLYEPEISLYGGEDGIQFYRRIFEEVSCFLKRDGYLIMEIGYNQINPIRKLLDSKELFLQKIIKDYNGIDRIIIVRNRDG